MDPNHQPRRPAFRLVAEDQAAIAFSVIWTAALVPPVLLLASPAAVPLVLVTPAARMVMRWSAFRAFVRDQPDRAELEEAINRLEVSVPRIDRATALGRLRRAFTAVAGGGVVLWSATTTVMESSGFTPLLGSVAAGSLLAMVAAGSVALVVAAGESVVERRPLLHGARRRVCRWWAALQLRCLPAVAPPDQYLTEAMQAVEAMLDGTPDRVPAPVASPR